MTYHEYFGYLLIADGHMWRFVCSIVFSIIFGFAFGFAIGKATN